jgi:hypothetical protein
MKKSISILLLFLVIFTGCKDDQNCGCTYPFSTAIYNSWLLDFTDVNGQKVASAKREVISFDATEKRTYFFQKTIDNLVIENTLIGQLKEVNTETKEMIVLMSIGGKDYKQKIRVIYDNQNIEKSLLATEKIASSDEFGAYVLHYNLIAKLK